MAAVPSRLWTSTEFYPSHHQFQFRLLLSWIATLSFAVVITCLSAHMVRQDLRYAVAQTVTPHHELLRESTSQHRSAFGRSQIVSSNPRKLLINTIVEGVIAGFVAAIVLSLLMMMKSAIGLMSEFNVIAMVSGMMGGGLAMGWIAHFMIGTGGILPIREHTASPHSSNTELSIRILPEVVLMVDAEFCSLTEFSRLSSRDPLTAR